MESLGSWERESQNGRKGGVHGEGQRKSAWGLERARVEWCGGKEGEPGGGGLAAGRQGAVFQKGWKDWKGVRFERWGQGSWAWVKGVD